MYIVNRGFISVKPKQAYIDWANQQDAEFQIYAENESTIYLIEEDFFDVEPIIERHFKAIVHAEIEAANDEAEVPEFNMETFKTWFSIEIGSTVVDLMDEGLNRE